MKLTTRFATAVGVLAAVLAPTAAATAATGPAKPGTHGIINFCARTFDVAQRVDMESFRDFDRATWVAGHDDDAIAVYSNGRVVQGREAIGDSQNSHFTNRNATWTWTELNRAVDGCSTGTIVYDATYAIPSAGFVLRQIVSVTYTFKRGHWLTVIDQGTPIPA
jgi:hypothetical protein